MKNEKNTPGNQEGLEDPMLHPKKKSDNELYLFSSDTLSLRNICCLKQSLDTLVVINQPNITSLNGISTLIHLRELWIIECQIRNVSHLQKCSKLERLYLYSNNIERIPNLSTCKHLALLSLSGNNISRPKNFETMPQLKKLYLANNKLKRIGNSLMHNPKLLHINLSGNPLCQLKDVINLSSLQHLESVVFVDSLYGECPLVYLCNYRYFVIHNLPRIKELDYYPVSSEERHRIKEFFKSKMIFYNMLWHKHLDSYLRLIKDLQEDYNDNISKLRNKLCAMRITRLRNIEDINSYSGIQEKKALQEMHTQLKVLYDSLEKGKDDAAINMEILQQQLFLKMQYCGNINFTEYTLHSGSTLVSICQKILKDSLCTVAKQNLGIAGVQLNRVTKIENKGTTAEFLENFSAEDLFNETNAVFKFVIFPRGIMELQKWPFYVIEIECFYEKNVAVTDCLITADARWLGETLLKQREINNFANVSTIKDLRRICVLACVPIAALSTKVETSDKNHSLQRICNTCPTFSVTNQYAVNPTFIIEYEYVLKAISRLTETPVEQTAVEPDLCVSSWQHLTINNIGRYLSSRQDDILNLVKINLASQGIVSTDISLDLPNLRELDISCNRLTFLPGIQMIRNLRKLYASFNDIETVYITEQLVQLEVLDISWNRLFAFLKDLQSLKNFSPNLCSLNVENNPFKDVVEFTLMMFLANISLNKLQDFNGTSCRNILTRSSRHFSWNIGGFEKIRQRFNNTSDIVLEPGKGFMISSDKKSNRIKHIDLSFNLTTQLDFLKEFPNVRELCMSNNLLTEALFIVPLKQLTKLNLSANYLSSSEGLTWINLPSLTILDLTDNLITSLQPMGVHENLEELYCSHNRISKLQEICNLKNWGNLYVVDFSSNPIDSNPLCRKFLTFHLVNVEYISGECVEKCDILNANRTFGGSLDKDTLVTMHNLRELTNIKQLSLTDCSIENVNLTSDVLPNLESLDLRSNQIKCLWGLHSLDKVQTLCLSHNRVGKFKELDGNELTINDKTFCSLTTLYLDHNCIYSLKSLDLHRMPALKNLFLQRNELRDLEGLELCLSVESLILDYNKIQVIRGDNFPTNNNVRTLFVEKNKIKYLSFVENLPKLQKLFAAHNKIEDKDQLDYLTLLDDLKELTLCGNPLCKKTNHYKNALLATKTLTIIDGHSVTPRDYFCE